jgi:hypothetical protein
MVALIQTSEETQAQTLATQALPSSFKYYIHDSVSALRFQLIGDFTGADVTELNGSWETAQPTLKSRRLVLDLCHMSSADESARRWLRQMENRGTALLPAAPEPMNAAKPRFLGRMLAIFKLKP